eukprot:gene12760-biopygen12467
MTGRGSLYGAPLLVDGGGAGAAATVVVIPGTFRAPIYLVDGEGATATALLIPGTFRFRDFSLAGYAGKVRDGDGGVGERAEGKCGRGATHAILFSQEPLEVRDRDCSAGAGGTRDHKGMAKAEGGRGVLTMAKEKTRRSRVAEARIGVAMVKELGDDERTGGAKQARDGAEKAKGKQRGDDGEGEKPRKAAGKLTENTGGRRARACYPRNL